MEVRMIRHIVVVRFQEGTSQEEKEAIVAALRALPDKISEIRQYEVGLDVVHSARSYDFGLISAFDDLEALKRSQGHPAHVPVAQRLQAASASVIAVDYAV